jgi:hypothetical protein
VGRDGLDGCVGAVAAAAPLVADDDEEDDEDEEDEEDDEEDDELSSRCGLASSLRRPSSSSGRTMSASCTQESYLLCQPSQCTKYSVPVNMRQQISVVTIINGELRKVRRR